MALLGQTVVIGSSRGLGAAIVAELVKAGARPVYGLSRTGASEGSSEGPDPNSGTALRSVKADITDPSSIEVMGGVAAGLDKAPLTVIFNAALVRSDVTVDGTVDYDVFDGVNKVAVDGLGNVLRAFEGHMLTHGGVLVAVSSFSAILPPVSEPRVAYPASKAYLDMAMRSLRVVWGKRASVMTVHLGHLGEGGEGGGVPFSGLLATSYNDAAAAIVKELGKESPRRVLGIPLIYDMVYRLINSFVPDRLYVSLLKLLSRK